MKRVYIFFVCRALVYLEQVDASHVFESSEAYSSKTKIETRIISKDNRGTACRTKYAEKQYAEKKHAGKR